MLRSMKDMETYSVGATDGIIGTVTDFYFDDATWVIRYLVVRTDDGLARRNVLISPISVGRPNWSDKILPVALTRHQIQHSPDIDTNKPVSRQHEVGYLGYYGYGNYWGGGGLWGAGFYPDLLQAGMQIDASSKKAQRSTDSLRHDNDAHLRSGNAVMRYYVHASDGDIGHVQGFLVEESTWAIRYVIVNTSNWWLGHRVIIAPEWIDHVDWADSLVVVALPRQAIQKSPSYDPAKPMSRQQEVSLFSHYGHEGYWPRESQHSENHLQS